jgi:hypothetical protein
LSMGGEAETEAEAEAETEAMAETKAKFSFAMDTASRVNVLRAFGRKMGHTGCALWTCVAYDV